MEIEIDQKEESPNVLQVILEAIDNLQQRKYVSSVYAEEGCIVITYDNGFKGKIKLPNFDNAAFKDECLKYVNIKLLEQKSEMISLLKDKLESVSKKEGPVGPKGDDGKQGDKGERGNGIRDAVIEQDGHLIIKKGAREKSA